jgi:type I restriction enzyme, S subunit
LSFQKRRLGDVVDFIRGITFKPEDVISPNVGDAVVCMRTKNIQKQLDIDDVIAIPKTFVRRDELFLCKGDILISSANSWNLVGKVAQVPDLPYKATAGGFIAIVRAKQGKIDSEYLYSWLASDSVQIAVRACGRQTTNISNLSVPQFLDLTILMPETNDQKEIVNILNKSAVLNRKRREAMSLADEFLRAVFLEMFGDPITNSYGWPIKRFESIGKLGRGVSKHRPRNDPSLLGGEFPLIQTGDVANCDGYIRSFIATYNDKGLKQSKLWPEGTLCITIAANIAKTGILLFPACFPDSVVGFSSENRAMVEYVRFWLSFLQQTIEANAPASAQKNINLAILRELQIPVPSLELIEKFASAVIKVESIRNAQRLSLHDSHLLARALQHKFLPA